MESWCGNTTGRGLRVIAMGPGADRPGNGGRWSPLSLCEASRQADKRCTWDWRGVCAVARILEPPRTALPDAGGGLARCGK